MELGVDWHSIIGTSCVAVNGGEEKKKQICVKMKSSCVNLQQNKQRDSLKHLQGDVDVVKLLLALVDVL